ncbi:hypothetical protein ACFORJ_06990 [Corynebacterium hansenii]|uniref:Uncharacterized protein n=1 Tax=Corynebacterium hansenii TaxID=394964 RepID=A0ABV7ZNS2_9CORY|nr:hypothetical protein [Corynebacterium hansenii]WJZ00492.1 hypothetical protein CHAN_09440 [Corynebacterium hansenii]
MTTNPTNEKTADVLAHVDGEAVTHKEETMTQPTPPDAYEIRLEDPGQSNGIDFAIYAGDRLPMRDHLRVIVPWDLLVAAARNGAITVTVSADDITEHDRRIHVRRAEREARAREKQMLAEARARALADAEDLLNNLDVAHLPKT